MQKKSLPVVLGTIILLGITFVIQFEGHKNTPRYIPRNNSLQAATGIEGAAQWLKMVRANPLTGTVEIEDIEKAYAEAEALKAEGKTSSLTLNWEEMGPDNIGGRTRALLFDKTTPSKMYAGGVSGGLWYSPNAGNFWYKYSDTLQNLAVSCITQAANGDIYFGTGEGFVPNGSGTNYTSVGIEGQGIWKSSDGGTTFNRLFSSWDTSYEKSSYKYVYQMAADPVNPNRIYAATLGGIRMSDNGGQNWQNPVEHPSAPGLKYNYPAHDVEVASDGSVWAVVNNLLFKSPNGDDGSFQKVVFDSNIPTSAGIGRLEIAVAPSDPNYIYISAATSTGLGTLYNIYQSKDKGNSWTIIGPGGGTFQPLGTQGIYDNAIAVAPNDPQTIIVGGLNLFKWVEGNGPGKGWKQLSQWYFSPPSPQYVHADIHTIKFLPSNSNIFYAGTDGGIFRTQDQGTNFQSANSGYCVTQFYAVAMSGKGEVMGGTQDNGSLYIYGKASVPQGSAKRADPVLGGDGGYADFSLINPEMAFASLYYGKINRWDNKSQNVSELADTNLAKVSGGFISPYRLWESFWGHPKTTAMDTSLFIGMRGSVWMSKDVLREGGNRWFKVAKTNGIATALEYTSNGDVVFVAITDTVNGKNKLYRISGLLYVRDTIAPKTFDLTNNPAITTAIIDTFTRAITGIAVDPVDPNRVIVTLGNYITGGENHVYITNDAMGIATFTSIQNNLPQMPVYDAVIDRWDSQRIYLGTDLGVYMSEDGGATWSEQNTGLARVPVFMIRQQLADSAGTISNTLVVATYGRGIFKSNTLVGIEAHDKKTAMSGLKIFPNPVSAAATVTYHVGTAAADAALTIYNLSGQVVKQIKLGRRQEGVYIQALDLHELSTGTYFLSLRAGDTVAADKFIITR